MEWSKISISNKPPVMCEMDTLDNILEQQGIKPHFEVLSVDTEGTEIDVLRGFTIDKWRPKMAIIETHVKNSDKRLSYGAKEINRYFTIHKYKIIYEDHVNTIYYKL